MKKLVIALLMIHLGCKSETENEVPIKLEVSKSTLQIGDSTKLSISIGKQIESVTIIPNVGRFRNGYYIAPATLANQQLLVTLQVTAGGIVYTTNCTIIRGLKTDSTISFSKTILPILTNNCNFSGCHGNGSRAGRVELSTLDSVSKHLVNYQPEQSILYLSLIKADPLRRMPPAGPLNQNRIQLIHNWIEQGSLNN
jgi:hypothetical protein